MTRAEEKRQTDLRIFCREITKVIVDKTPADMPALFAEMKPPKGCTRYDVFQMLDEKPGLFSVGGSYFAWHHVLRIARNTPDIGRAMFKAINGEKT
jgi:hypothetical protein